MITVLNERLLSRASETARRHGRELEIALRAPPDSFFGCFCGKLREGEVRIIFFQEESSRDLRIIADFLNRQMTRTEVLVVEARLVSTFEMDTGKWTHFDRHGTVLNSRRCCNGRRLKVPSDICE